MRTTATIVRAIARGAATVLYVPVTNRGYSHHVGKTRTGQSKGRTVVSKPSQPAVGDQLPVHGGTFRLGKWATDVALRAELAAVERTVLGDLTPEEALEAGFATPDEFVQAWVRHHDREWLTRQTTYLIEQGVAEEEALETEDEWAKVRYRDRWSTRSVWKFTVRPVHDVDQFLEPAKLGHSEHGYVTGSDPLDAGRVLDAPDPRWSRRAVRAQLEALSENAGSGERSRRARALGRRVRALALQDPTLSLRIEALLREAERDAAA